MIEKAVDIVQTEIKKRGGIFKLMCGPTRIGSKGDGVDMDRNEIIAGLAQNEDDSQGEESNDEGINIDMEDNIQVEEDDEEEKQAS
mgnify:CR=1 FL=1